MSRVGPGIVAAALLIAACDGGTASVTTTASAARDNATFCSVFAGEYREALAGAVPVTDDAFAERSAEIVDWAGVLAGLAPVEIATQAADNLRYHEAQAARRSAADYIPGSNEMHAWANGHC